MIGMGADRHVRIVAGDADQLGIDVDSDGCFVFIHLAAQDKADGLLARSVATFATDPSFGIVSGLGVEPGGMAGQTVVLGRFVLDAFVGAGHLRFVPTVNSIGMQSLMTADANLAADVPFHG